MDIIPPDDVMQFYIEANEGQKGMVSDILNTDNRSGVYSVASKKGAVSVYVSCTNDTGSKMMLAIMDMMKTQFGMVWLENLLKRSQKIFLD